MPQSLAESDQMQQGMTQELRDLVIDLFDIRCLLFGEFKQASGAIFNYYVDLRQIISDPALFRRVLDCYAQVLRPLCFNRIAGIPYGSLPTATGLSLQLHKPLIYPRKEVKAHGTRRLVEGEFNEGETVAVVDDILITGGSVLEGIPGVGPSRRKALLRGIGSAERVASAEVHELADVDGIGPAMAQQIYDAFRS